MPRRLRAAQGGYVYHVLNRAVGRMTLFAKPGDYAAFNKVLRQAHEQCPLRLLAFALMPNHWHLVVWPRHNGELSRYMHWLTMTHTQRWHAHRHTVGTGPLYQGRFKSFPIQEDAHLLTVYRYVERNALRAGLVGRAEQWPWSSLVLRHRQRQPVWLYEGPVPLPAEWQEWINEAQTEKEVEALRASVQRGIPWGASDWQQSVVRDLGLESSCACAAGRRRVARHWKRLPTPYS